jgi:6-phosphogluconolactonase
MTSPTNSNTESPKDRSSFAGADTVPPGAASARVYIGTQSKQGRAGVYLAQLDRVSGRLSEPRPVAEPAGQTFLATDPQQQRIYSVVEQAQSGSGRTGMVCAFAIDQETGDLRLLNSESSGGQGPCHLTVDPRGRCVLVAHYTSGSVAVLPLNPDGKLRSASSIIEHTGRSVHPQRQTRPHAHAIRVHPSAPFAFAADLGTDQLLAYRYDSETGILEPSKQASLTAPPGAGPRHFAFHPSLDTLYLINELDSTLLVVRFDPDEQRLVTLQRLSTLPDDFEGTSYPSEVAVHPSGRFVYGANRGHDTLAVFKVDESGGLLESIGFVDIEGNFPRHFAIDPTGQFLIAAHQRSNNLAIFRIDLATGLPHFTGQHVGLGGPMAILYQLPASDADVATVSNSP